jgi:pimeloyl-ACP methyl ester carboxylesterase
VRAQTSFGEIAYEILGDGPPVVLVHGTPSRGALWRNVAPVLADGHCVHVFDLLGFGDSEKHVEQEVSVAVHGRVLAELVELWELEAPALVGHDIGGATVLRAHLVEGVPVSSISLVDAVALRPWITPRTREMQKQLHLYDSLPDPELTAIIRMHLGTATHGTLDPQTYDLLFGQWDGERGQALYLRNLAQFDETHTDEFEPLLPSIEVPVLILWGAQDRWLPFATGERLAELIPGSELVAVPDAGHFSMEDQPEAVAAELRRFLA